MNFNSVTNKNLRMIQSPDFNAARLKKHRNFPSIEGMMEYLNHSLPRNHNTPKALPPEVTPGLRAELP